MRSQSLKHGIEAFFVTLLVGLTHRATTFFILFPPGELSRQTFLESLLVGSLSDLWVAALVGVACGLLSLVAKRYGSLGFVFLLTVGAAAHQAYVEFFRFPVVPAHIRYLVDGDFISANAISIVTLGGAAAFLAYFVAIFVVRKGLALDTWTDKKMAIFALSVVLVAGIGHNRNIRWREQWYVPTHVQMNPLEALSIKWQRYQPFIPLTASETKFLAAELGVPAPALPASKSDKHKLLTRVVGEVHASEFAKSLRAHFATARALGKKPLFAIILMESQRPSETGFLHPETPPSLTPRMDSLAAQGVAFSRAFSTGSVTRGGQEAVACGYLGGRDTSMMRGASLATLRCLPELVVRDPSGRFVWLHAGEGGFDSQVRFWRARGANATIAEDAFSPDAPKTGWGKSDWVFFERAAAELLALHAKPEVNFTTALLLSVTNHIPWDRPADMPEPIAMDPALQGHKSHRTTKYADEGLGRLVDALRAGGMWDEAFVIIVSDHGNRIPRRGVHDPALGPEDVVLQSHVNLVLTGGLVDKAVAELPGTPRLIDRVVSQADVAALGAYVLGFDGERFMGEDPLLPKRHLPVIASLEENVFFPELAVALTLEKAAQQGPEDEAPKMRAARLYYRLFLDYIATR